MIVASPLPVYFDENFSRESIVNALAVWWQVKEKHNMNLGMELSTRNGKESL